MFAFAKNTFLVYREVDVIVLSPMTILYYVMISVSYKVWCFDVDIGEGKNDNAHVSGWLDDI